MNKLGVSSRCYEFGVIAIVRSRSGNASRGTRQMKLFCQIAAAAANVAVSIEALIQIAKLFE